MTYRSSSAGQAARALWHLGRSRSLEVLVLQASPLLGAAFGEGWSAAGPAKLATMLAGSTLLTAHVFAFNDWAGRQDDLNDPRRAPRVFAQYGIGSKAVATVAVTLLATAMVALAAVGFGAVVLGAAICCLGILYSDSEAAGKGVPGLASLIHLLGGTLHFLLGYGLGRPIDGNGVAIATFFGLAFAAGHLNQEVRDHDADRRNGIRTTAVVFGARPACWASLAVFSAAYGELVLLAWLGVVPRPLLCVALLWPLHAAWSLAALRGGAGFDQARWLQRRYRLLFTVVGLLMVLSLGRAHLAAGLRPRPPALAPALAQAAAMHHATR